MKMIIELQCRKKNKDSISNDNLISKLKRLKGVELAENLVGRKYNLPNFLSLSVEGSPNNIDVYGCITREGYKILTSKVIITNKYKSKNEK